MKCPDKSLQQPFAPWQDLDSYALAPGGNFEKKVDDWVLTGGAGIIGGNQPFFRDKQKDDRSLALPPESEATTSEVCVGVRHPTLRFFVRRLGGPDDATLTVRANVQNPAGGILTVEIPDAVTNAGVWAPGAPVVIGAPVMRLLGEVTVNATFTLIPSPGSSWQVDDFFIDPWRSR